MTMTITEKVAYLKGLADGLDLDKEPSKEAKLLTKIMYPDSGSITMEGHPIYENPAIKERICSIGDESFHFPSANLEDMRKFYKGIYPRFDDELFNRLYEVFQLPKTGSETMLLMQITMIATYALCALLVEAAKRRAE